MKPDISVVIPTRNEGKYIERTLKQYLSLKKKFNIEVIVSDGNSTDNTVKIARRYADRVVVNNRKTTIAIGRNAGARVARGEILFHTDADVMIPDKVKFFSKLMKTFKDDEVVAATTKLRIYPREEIFRDKVGHALLNITMWVSNVTFSFLAKGECQAVRASIFRKIGGYNEKIVLGEDCDLFFRLAKRGKIKYLRSLTIYNSSRRFRKEGYLKLFVFYAVRDGLFLLFTGKSFVKEWKPIR